MHVIYHEDGLVIAVHRKGTEPRSGYPGTTRTVVADLSGLIADPDGGPQRLSSTAPTVEDVRAEAARRMRALLGARDAAHLEIIVSNGLRETVRLQQIILGGGSLKPAELARKAALEWADAALETIRAASNALEAMSPVPADFADDAKWG